MTSSKGILVLSIDKDANEEVLDLIVANKLSETAEEVFAVEMLKPFPKKQLRVFVESKAIANKMYKFMKKKYKRKLAIRKYDVQKITKEFMQND